MNNTTQPVTVIPPQEVNITQLTYHNQEKDILGCTHYQRNCRIKAPCCQKIFTCRRCHDEQISDHKINRYDIETMICMFCQTTQPVNQICQHCQKSMAAYFCGICKFFDDDLTKGIWHCAACGLCRLGGKDNYVHCDICHMCLSPGPHKHTERAFECNCPICNEYLLTSTMTPIKPEPCNHPIHASCYKKLIKNERFSCPVCNKSYSELKDFLQDYWSQKRQFKNANPMPSEYRNWRIEVLCYDCEKRTESDFHWLGTECSHCHGWNNTITKTIPPH
jgi:RING finger/CHY zinc finger protein 1